MRFDIERFHADDLIDDARAWTRSAGIKVMAPVLDRIDVHWHDYYELGYVLDGTAEHVVNGVGQTIGPGSAFLLSPADFHEIQSTSGTPMSSVNVVIEPSVIEGQLDLTTPGDAWIPLQARDFVDADADMRRLLAESQRSDSGSRVVIDSLVRCVVVELARHCQPTERAASSDGLAAGGVSADLRRAIAFVERHFREQLTLADAASEAHLSPNYFSERFRVATGQSFQTYLQGRRLRFAHALLGSTDLGVTEVCHAAGFNSVSHFGRAYRRQYGEAPSRRKRHIEGAEIGLRESIAAVATESGE